MKFDGNYEYKGFIISYSDEMAQWELEPSYLEDVKQLENIYNSFEMQTFNTIEKAKKYLDKNSEQLKADINKFLGVASEEKLETKKINKSIKMIMEEMNCLESDAKIILENLLNTDIIVNMLKVKLNNEYNIKS